VNECWPRRNFSSQGANTPTLPTGAVRDEMFAILSKGFPPVNTMLTADPPLQTRYRKTVGRAFSTRRILSLEPRIREICRDLISRWPARGRVPFHDEFAVLFPVRVISHALNSGRRSRRIKPWSGRLGRRARRRHRDAAARAARGLVECSTTGVGFEDRRRAADDT
jgi:cytochrome P450